MQAVEAYRLLRREACSGLLLGSEGEHGLATARYVFNEPSIPIRYGLWTSSETLQQMAADSSSWT